MSNVVVHKPDVRKRLSLYDLDAAWLDLQDRLEESGGELTPEDMELMDQLATDRPKKFEAICCIIRELAAKEAAYKSEVERLQKRAMAAINAQFRLKQYLLQSMVLHKENRVECGTFKLSRCKNSRSALTFDLPEDVDEQFLIVETKPNTEAIRAAAEAGTIAWARIEPRGEHVRIN